MAAPRSIGCCHPCPAATRRGCCTVLRSIPASAGSDVRPSIITVVIGIATIALAGSLVVIRMAEMGDVVFAVIGVVLFAIVLGWTAFHLLPDPFEEFNGWFGPTGPIDLESMKNIKINTNGATA